MGKAGTKGVWVMRVAVVWGGWLAAAIPAFGQVSEVVIDGDMECFRVQTPAATYLYGKRGAGFASIIDKQGKDWISYHHGDKTLGEYRGMPKCGQPTKFFHCGYGFGQYKTENVFVSRVTQQETEHVRIESGKFEEINRGVAGANYVWPTVEHGTPDDGRFRGAVHTYPQASVSGGDFCSTSSAWSDAWRGHYFFADFVHGWIKAIDPDNPEQVESFAGGLSRPVDLRFSRDGKLYVLLRNAWVIDTKFVAGTSALLEISETSH